MLLIGHIGISVLLGRLIGANLTYVAGGALLPDLIDKILKVLGIAPAGRYIGHTLFIGLLIFAISYVFTRSRKNAASTTFGVYLHLLEDLPYFIPWLYPFIDYTWPQVPMLSSLNLMNFAFEFIGLACLVITLNERYWRSISLPVIQNNVKSRAEGD